MKMTTDTLFHGVKEVRQGEAAAGSVGLHYKKTGCAPERRGVKNHQNVRSVGLLGYAV